MGKNFNLFNFGKADKIAIELERTNEKIAIDVMLEKYKLLVDNNIRKFVIENSVFIKSVNTEEFKRVVSDYKYYSNKINVNTNNFNIYKANPKYFLNPNRFDFLAKYILTKYFLIGIESDFHINLYKNHIYCWNGFNEPSSNNKKNENDFLEVFYKLIEKMSKNKFDYNESIIIINKNGIALDGSHRIGISLAMNNDVPYTILDFEDCKYDYKFFKKMKAEYLDYMAYSLCECYEDVKIMTLFPCAEGKDYEIRKIMAEYCEIYYEKEINIENGDLFILQLYWKENWIGNWENTFNGVKTKSQGCYSKEGKTKVFIIKSTKNDNLVEMKEKIRKLFENGKDSVHINDTHEETMSIASVVFNQNSIDFINTAKLKYFKNFSELFKLYENSLSKIPFKDNEKYCISSSAVLSLYGLRDCQDIDYLSVENEIECDMISNHKSQLEYYSYSQDDIVYNPENHFYFCGIKFATPKVIYEMKHKRGEDKDKIDIELLKKYI